MAFGDVRLLLRGLSRLGGAFGGFFVGDFLFFFSDDDGCRRRPVSFSSLSLLSSVALIIFAGAGMTSMSLDFPLLFRPSSPPPTKPPSLSIGTGFSTTLPSKSSSETSVASPSPSACSRRRNARGRFEPFAYSKSSPLSEACSKGACRKRSHKTFPPKT